MKVLNPVLRYATYGLRHCLTPQDIENWCDLNDGLWRGEFLDGWLLFRRRLSKDYEHSPRSSETMAQIAKIHLMLKRLPG